MSGRVPSGQALPPSAPEPCGLRPSGNDPSRVDLAGYVHIPDSETDAAIRAAVSSERAAELTSSNGTLFRNEVLSVEEAADAIRMGIGARLARTIEPHVFLDCDGVLADFDTYAEAYFGNHPREYERLMGSERFWAELEAKGDFYRNLPLMPDAMALYEGVKHLHPTILTGCPRGNWAQGQKVAWAAEHFPGVPIITCRSADKRDYAKPGDVLIDDWAQHRHRWIEMGGVFITHHDAKSSLAALWAHYPMLASAMSARSGETEGLAPKDASAVPPAADAQGLNP